MEKKKRLNKIGLFLFLFLLVGTLVFTLILTDKIFTGNTICIGQSCSISVSINVVNPLSKNIELIEGNPYGYLFQVPEKISAQRLSKLARDSSWYDSLSHPGLILTDLARDTLLLDQYFREFEDDSTFQVDSVFLFDPLDREQISNYIHRDTLDSISISHIF